ncbi:CsbD family protein [Rathayibacter sp. VKM Ac-2857]|uniref:CsbD family protein n=1 Tax=Rathayibacter sp. VKM Ac-2857 TaxID=2739020 RepID=UPI0015651466|nr:CsbD family protein [Rathayibacter sp. VKM Ac-2857]NQX15307.1 CsbD family protein [Rathayibacter sp. VKM Ac-2857]
MGADDKIRNAAENLLGKAKEAAGKLTDNEKLEAEGQADQAKAQTKKVGEDVKDVFKN